MTKDLSFLYGKHMVGVNVAEIENHEPDLTVFCIPALWSQAVLPTNPSPGCQF